MSDIFLIFATFFLLMLISAALSAAAYFAYRPAFDYTVAATLTLSALFTLYLLLFDTREGAA